MISTCEDVLKMGLHLVGVDIAHATSSIVTVMDIYSLMVLLVVWVRIGKLYPST